MSTTQDTPFTMDEYWRTRNYKTSARLHLQHELFQGTIGFYLHPRVAEMWSAPDAKDRTFRVADLGCGNARWLCKLSREAVPEGVKVQFFGFDINPVNFPNAANIPDNIKLQKLDLLTADLPEGLVGTFDVVHLRAFTSLVYNNDPSVVMRAATSLLKPGGWLQWEETASDQRTAASYRDGVSKTSCDAIIHILNEGGKSQKLFQDWLHKLDSHFRDWNLLDTELVSFDKRPEDFKAWTEDYLLVFEDIGPMLPSKATSPDAPLTREMWQDLFLKVVEETDKGVVIHQRKVIVAIGKKAG